MEEQAESEKERGQREDREKKEKVKVQNDEIGKPEDRKRA